MEMRNADGLRDEQYNRADTGYRPYPASTMRSPTIHWI